MPRTPPGGAGPGIAGNRRLLGIGAVVGLLREEFPEVTISKIRFLESEGLVEPRRTPSGYRKFDGEDVERLARVLRMQRDHYLPLKVIKEHLDAGRPGPDAAAVRLPAQASGEASGPARGAADGAAAAAGTGVPGVPAGPERRLARAELLEAIGAEEAELAQWESYGLVGAEPDGSYRADAARVGRLVRELAAFGLEARHLRAVKAAADRDAGLVEQVVAPLRRHRNPQTRAHAEATARELATLCVRLHAALVQSALGLRSG